MGVGKGEGGVEAEADGGGGGRDLYQQRLALGVNQGRLLFGVRGGATQLVRQYRNDFALLLQSHLHTHRHTHPWEETY